jgi:hypothetical protein
VRAILCGARLLLVLLDQPVERHGDMPSLADKSPNSLQNTFAARRADGRPTTSRMFDIFD